MVRRKSFGISADSAGAQVALAVTILAWASGFVGIRAALRAYSPAHVALLRYATASVVLGIYATATRMKLPQLRDWPGLALLGLIGIAFYNVALSRGQLVVPAATASFLIASAPVWMALFGVFVLRERLAAAGWTGVVLSLAGVATIALGSRQGLKFSAPVILVLAAALAQSFYSLGQKALLQRYTAIQVTSFAIWSGTLFLLPFSGGLSGQVLAAPFAATAALIYLGVVPGALGYVAWAYGLSRIPASRAGTYLYLVPALTMLIGWIWLGEVPTAISVAGGVLVVAGVVVVGLLGGGRGPTSSRRTA